MNVTHNYKNCESETTVAYADEASIRLISPVSFSREYTYQVYFLSLNILIKSIGVLILFYPMFPFDPPQTSEKLLFSDAFWGIKRKHWEKKG